MRNQDFLNSFGALQRIQLKIRSLFTKNGRFMDKKYREGVDIRVAFASNAKRLYPDQLGMIHVPERASEPIQNVGQKILSRLLKIKQCVRPFSQRGYHLMLRIPFVRPFALKLRPCIARLSRRWHE